jgi:hypothetical protein
MKADVIEIQGIREQQSVARRERWEMIPTEGSKGAFHSSRHCEERKRRSHPFFPRGAWIASRSLSSGGALRRPVDSQ